MGQSSRARRALSSLLVLLSLALLVYGRTALPFITVWVPRFDLRWLTHWLMVPSAILLLAGLLPRGYLAWTLRQPLLVGVVLWSLAHLWSNGDLASIILFGGFGLWAGAAFVSSWGRGQQPKRAPRPLWDVLALVLGLIGYLSLFVLHGELFGIGLSIE